MNKYNLVNTKNYMNLSEVHSPSTVKDVTLNATCGNVFLYYMLVCVHVGIVFFFLYLL